MGIEKECLRNANIEKGISFSFWSFVRGVSTASRMMRPYQSERISHLCICSSLQYDHKSSTDSDEDNDKKPKKYYGHKSSTGSDEEKDKKSKQSHKKDIKSQKKPSKAKKSSDGYYQVNYKKTKGGKAGKCDVLPVSLTWNLPLLV